MSPKNKTLLKNLKSSWHGLDCKSRHLWHVEEINFIKQFSKLRQFVELFGTKVIFFMYITTLYPRALYLYSNKWLDYNIGT